VGGINQTILTGLGFKVFKLIYFTLEKDMGTFLSTIQFICKTQTSKGKKNKKTKNKEKKKHLASCLLACFRESIIRHVQQFFNIFKGKNYGCGQKNPMGEEMG